jgi:beta-lactamase class D
MRLFYFLILSLFPLIAFAQHKQFEGVDGCFLLTDLKTGKELVRYGGKFCEERLAACSTFKVPLALMAFDKAVLKDENSLLKWDRKERAMPAWNKDHTAASWMKDSVVWFSQELTPKLGAKVIESYLKKFGFGTSDMSGGITNAWLNEPAEKNTEKISADEQLKFMTRLFKNDLPVSKHALATTQKIMFIENSANGAVLSGKTGSGLMNMHKGQKIRQGWFVAHIKKGDKDYVSVTGFVDKRKDPPYKFGGPHARDIAKQILAEQGIY